MWFSWWVLCLGAALGMLIFWSGLGGTIATPGSPLNRLVASIGTRNWLFCAAPLSFLCMMYMFIALIGTWRSSRRYTGWKGWRWLAWIGVLLMLYGLVRLVFILLIQLLFGA